MQIVQVVQQVRSLCSECAVLDDKPVYLLKTRLMLMSNIASNTTLKNKKLPKNIATMVQKNNLVIAIKTLVEEEGISFDEAKERIDAYEFTLKQQQQTKQNKIAKKQAKQDDFNTSSHKNALDNLKQGVDEHLAEQGYKKPLLPYWLKRVFWILLAITCVVVGIYLLVRW